MSLQISWIFFFISNVLIAQLANDGENVYLIINLERCRVFKTARASHRAKI